MLNKTDISVLYINYNYKKMKLINSPIYTERIRRFTVKREGCQLKTLRSSPISLFVGKKQPVTE